MKTNRKGLQSMPDGLRWFSSTLFFISCVTLVQIVVSLWWDWSKHGLSNGILDYIPKEQYVSLGTAISGAGIAAWIGCFWGWRWIRYYIPLLMAGMAIFSFGDNRPWDGCGSLTWMVITAIYLFRSSRVAAYFNQGEQGAPSNR